MKDVPKELDVIAGAVLRYRPKPKTKAEWRKDSAREARGA